MARRIVVVVLASLLFVPSAWARDSIANSLYCYIGVSTLDLIAAMRLHGADAETIYAATEPEDRHLVRLSFQRVPSVMYSLDPDAEFQQLSDDYYDSCRKLQAGPEK